MVGRADSTKMRYHTEPKAQKQERKMKMHKEIRLNSRCPHGQEVRRLKKDRTLQNSTPQKITYRAPFCEPGDQSIIIRDGIWVRFEESSVVFSASLFFFLLMWGFKPRLKLWTHMQALTIVITIKNKVMTAKKVIDGRAGRYLK